MNLQVTGRDRIGIMGGTFNPIHIGHLLLAEWAKEMGELDKVLFIPTGISYMKTGRAMEPSGSIGSGDSMEPSGEQRLAMVQLAIEGNPSFEASDIEIRRLGFTYTYETLEILTQAHPDRDYYFIMGADCLFTMENWREPERIFQQAQLIAAIRGGQATRSLVAQMETKRRELEQHFHGKIMLMQFPEMDISSTDIRKRISRGQSIRYLVPEPVRRYIHEEHLYQ
jgi:nicotinate-nucleotide adenylyltransferase